MNFKLVMTIYSCAWFSFVYLIFAYGLWFLFPKYVQIRFSRIPNIRIVTLAYQILYFIFLIFSVFISFELNIWFYAGLIIYLSGLALYISAIYYFAINEWDKAVTGGIYKLLKHPVYFGFSLIMFGISIAGQSLILFVLAVIISYLSHLIAKQEEKDCLEKYGEEYREYLAK